MQSAAILIKEKYGLAHIPSRHKMEKWAELVHNLMKQGYTAEQAGMEAARRIFTYEYKEVYVRSGATVREILSKL